MRIALITDTHFGGRGDSPVFSEYLGKFYQDVFFPYLKENNITKIIHLGDIVDRRKYISYLSLRHFKKQFIEPVIENNIDLDIIIGNHDTFYKNTNDVNCMTELFGTNKPNNINWHTQATDMVFDGCNILFVPWICSGNFEHTMETMSSTKAEIVFGHLELAGFEMQKGNIIDHGYDPKMFSKFDTVLTGHYHHRSTRGNVTYLGCPYEIVWSDHDDPKGFHVFDTDTREIEFVENPLTLFEKYFYDDLDKEHGDVVLDDYSHLRGKFVKVVVQNKVNPYWFDSVIDRIERAQVADLQVVEDHLHLDLEEDSDIIQDAEDTLTIIRKFSEQYIGNKQHAPRLNKLLGDLYSEAMELQTTQ
jgi:DNA repair exonuclease SbcCD nuclease subunit